MNYYQDLTLLSDLDIGLGFLWHKVYQQVHIALVEQKVDDHHSAIAVGFPEYGCQNFPLGSKLRMFAKEKSQLEALNLNGFLTRLQDYTHVKSIQPVPETKSMVAFVRQHVKGQARIEKDMLNKAHLWAKKSGKSVQFCMQELEKTKPKFDSKLPFIWLESQETKTRNPTGFTRFPLFIERIELTAKKDGFFNCYGLSAKLGQHLASVPNF